MEIFHDKNDMDKFGYVFIIDGLFLATQLVYHPTFSKLCIFNLQDIEIPLFPAFC